MAEADVVCRYGRGLRGSLAAEALTDSPEDEETERNNQEETDQRYSGSKARLEICHHHTEEISRRFSIGEQSVSLR